MQSFYALDNDVYIIIIMLSLNQGILFACPLNEYLFTVLNCLVKLKFQVLVFFCMDPVQIYKPAYSPKMYRKESSLVGVSTSRLLSCGLNRGKKASFLTQMEMKDQQLPMSQSES